MGTTADKLNYLIETKRRIKNALLVKGVSISENEPFRSYADAIIDIPQEVNGTILTPVEIGDVNFYDYDGKLLYAYNAAEFLNMTELPALPTTEGLTSLGWNMGLSYIKEMITTCGKCDVGAVYTTADGLTKIIIELKTEEQLRLFSFTVEQNSQTTRVNWGDGTDIETSRSGGAVTFSHTYANIGRYTISIEGTTGKERLSYIGGTNTYTTGVVEELYMGDSIIISGGYYQNLSNLKKIVISPYSTGISNGYKTLKLALRYTPNLQHITIPNSIENIELDCAYSGVKHIICPEGCDQVSIDCIYSGLEYIVLPIANIINTFRGSYSHNLRHIYNTSGYWERFSGATNCMKLKELQVPDSIDTINDNAFTDCLSLSKIILPQTLASLGSSSFNSCISLSEIIIPENVHTIPYRCFYACTSLCKVIFPSSIESIGTQAFDTRSTNMVLDFSAAIKVPKPVSNSYSQLGDPRAIIVPDDLYDEWVVQWGKNYASQIVKASEYNG